MVAKFYQIEQILIEAYLSLDLNLPTAYPNKGLTSAPDGLWISLANLRGISTVATLGASGTDNNPGIFQISVNYPLHKGTREVNQLCDQIAAYFPAGKHFESNGVVVTVSNTSLDEGRPVEGYWCASVSVSYYSRNPRH